MKFAGFIADAIIQAATAATTVWTEETCPGHVASNSDSQTCDRCGVHINELRPFDEDDDDILTQRALQRDRETYDGEGD